MKKIEELQLFNFKFFTDSDNTLKIGKKNLLIWGENGSGKSSIYWAIYTILQCSFKDDSGVNAYFTANGPKNLINIHAIPGSDSFIRMKLDDGNEYFIALDGRKNVQGITDLQLSAVSSDFIDFNVVASFMRAYHRDDLHLFEMFEEEIFRYLKFTSPTTSPIDFFDNAWAEIQKGLPKDSGSKKFPSSGSTVHDQYRILVDAFNLQLRTILGLVTVKANEILETKFKLRIEIELLYKKVDFTLSRNFTSFKIEEPGIQLIIKKYNGREDVVKKPHSFLNEAKKTAIGLAIRLGILERRLLDDTKLNVLALDDLLISLDMSNRDVVLKMLFSDYMDKYQLLIFTHDRQFFNIAKHKIEFNYDKTKWGFWEFYVDERTAIEKPRIFENETELSIANKHLLNNDYPAAANYLRKHCEKIIEKHLPEFLYANIEKKESNTTNTLDSVLISTSIFLARIKQPAAVGKVNEVKQYVKMLLNPLSHTERGVERYKGEIKAIMKLLDELEPILKAINKKKIINSNEYLFLKLQKGPNQFFRIKLKLREDLYIANTATGIQISLVQTDSEHYWELDNANAIVKEGQYTFIQNKELFESYETITTHRTINIPVVANWQNLLSIENGTTLNALMTF